MDNPNPSDRREADYFAFADLNRRLDLMEANSRPAQGNSEHMQGARGDNLAKLRKAIVDVRDEAIRKCMEDPGIVSIMEMKPKPPEPGDDLSSSAYAMGWLRLQGVSVRFANRMDSNSGLNLAVVLQFSDHPDDDKRDGNERSNDVVYETIDLSDVILWTEMGQGRKKSRWRRWDMKACKTENEKKKARHAVLRKENVEFVINPANLETKTEYVLGVMQKLVAEIKASQNA